MSQRNLLHPTDAEPARWRNAARIVMICFGACLLIFAVLSLWNIEAEARLRRQHPVPGDFYSVGGRQMHIYCSGMGSPTVILESAASARWTQWRKVQPELSNLTRVCSYDRAGHGWSERRRGLRDAETIVSELHLLLDQVGVERPFIYAGESAGGLYVREYAREHPAEITGVALIESSSPQQIDELPGWRADYEKERRDAERALWKDRLLVWFGWERLLGHCSSGPNAVDCRDTYVDMDQNELPYFEESSREAGRLTTFGSVPLLIVTKDANLKHERTAQDAAQDAVWDKEQETSKGLSPLSWRVIARSSGHIVPIDRRDVVVAEITQLIRYLRGGPAPPFGSTATE